VDTLHLVTGLPTSAVTVERLRGDALGSAAGITVDRATVAADGSVTPGTVETGTARQGEIALAMPRPSAAIIALAPAR